MTVTTFAAMSLLVAVVITKSAKLIVLEYWSLDVRYVKLCSLLLQAIVLSLLTLFQ